MKKIITTKKEFDKLIKRDKFQVFLFMSKLYIPFNFAVHLWIVTSAKGKIDRWEVWQKKNSNKTSWGYLHKNLVEPSIGIEKYLHKNLPRNNSKIVGYQEGNENSLAQRIIKFLNKNAKNYPFKDKYKLYPGPNSNTFPKWIMKNFPGTKWKLPWNAFGKNYLKN